MVRSVLWKEWREQRWKAVFGAVMMVFFTVPFLQAKLTTPREFLSIVSFLGGLLLALYSAMGVFAPERSNGTLPFLASKPIPPATLFACKWFVGWANVAVPLLCGGICFFIVDRLSGTGAAPRPEHLPPSMIVQGTVVGLGAATGVYAMICCFAPRRAGEGMVGVAGLLVFAGLALHLALVGMLWEGDPASSGSYLWYVNPLYWAAMPQATARFLRDAIPFAVVQLFMGTSLVYVTYRRWSGSL